MSKFMDAQKRVEQHVVSVYRKIEKGVKSGYEKVESSAVSGFEKNKDRFNKTFLPEGTDISFHTETAANPERDSDPSHA